jgi:DNA/RNA-binding domain of Phe-tRNA-synthetase-like protein
VKFKIDPAVFSFFPQLHIGVVCAEGVDNRGDCSELLEKIKRTQNEIRTRFDRETLAACPKIQTWRNAYSLFGAKPKKHLSSVENLYRLTLEGNDLRAINKLVNIYNWISLRHMVPVGGDDLKRVDGDIVLRFALGDEPFRPLGSDEVHKAKKGEVIYMDEREVLCRRWNWRESEKTKMTEDTREVLLVSEGLPPVEGVEMNKIVEELAFLVTQYCGGEIRYHVLNAGMSEWEIWSGFSDDSMRES